MLILFRSQTGINEQARGWGKCVNSSYEFVGNILANTSITFTTGAPVDGQRLAETGAVTLDGNTITAVPEPASSSLLIAGFVSMIVGVGRIRRHYSHRISI
jgi:hypothetical protein